MKLNVPRVNSEIGKRYFYFRSIHTWNELDEGVVSATSINAFKNKFDSFIKARN